MSLSSQIKRLVQHGVCLGIDREYLLDCNLEEAKDTIEAYAEKRRLDMKQQASMDYIQARTTAIFVSTMFSKNAKAPELEEVYPSLFGEELKEKREEEERQSRLLSGWMNFYYANCAKNERERLQAGEEDG